ncbi:MAG TPA: DUF5667 domain-containing protein [Chloroflexota bacterium]|nr:DUF5667 domain-containing protein [Chloroflexota bacterium]
MAELPPHEVLGECLERLEQGRSVDELLAQHPALRAELEPLLALAARLRALPRVQAPARLRHAPLWRRHVASPPPAATYTDPVELLAACLEAEAAAAGSAAALLAQHPALRDEVAPLVELAGQLRTLAALQAPARLREHPAWREAPPSPTEPLQLPDRSEAEVLAAALEAEEQRPGGAAAVLALYPEHREALAPLVALADELRAMPKLRAPARLREHPAWREGLPPRARAAAESPSQPPRALWAAAERDAAARPHLRTVRSAQAPSERRWRMTPWGRIAAGAAGATLALLLAGTVATSATSLPDEPLYPVKRLVEDAQLFVAPPESKLDLHLRRAQERMKETREMIERDRPDVVASLAEAYVREVEAVRQELHSERAQSLPPQQVGRVITQLEADRQMLGAVVDRAPEPARPAVARAAEASRADRVAPVPPSIVSVPEAVTLPAEASAAPPASVVEPAAPARAVPPAPEIPAAFQPVERPPAVAPPAAEPPAVRFQAPAMSSSLLPSPTPGTASPTAPPAGGANLPVPAPSSSPPAASPTAAPSQGAPVGGPSPTSSPAPFGGGTSVPRDSGQAPPVGAPTATPTVGSAFQLLPPLPTATPTRAAPATPAPATPASAAPPVGSSGR